MANGYFEQNRGVVAGSAFFNSFMKSYNQSLAMQADIERYRTQQLRYQESSAYAQGRLDISARGLERSMRDDVADAELEYAKALDYDRELRLEPDSPLYEKPDEESEYTKAARRNLLNLKQSSETRITGFRRSEDPGKEPVVEEKPGLTRIGLKDSAGDIGDTFMAPDEYAISAVKPKKKMSFKRFIGSIRKRNTMIGDIDRWDKPAPKITGIGRTTARDLFDMADDVDLGNFAEIRKAIPNIQDILLEDPEDTKRLFMYLKKGQLPDGRPFGTKEAIALLRQLQED